MFFFALTCTLFVSRRWKDFTLSSLAISSKAAILYSLLFSYLLECGKPLLSLSCLSPQRQEHFTLSSLLIFSKVVILCSLFLLAFLPSTNLLLLLFFSLGFTLYFPSLHREDPWARVIKFFVTLSIYMTLFLFPLKLRIHYFFNKE